MDTILTMLTQGGIPTYMIAICVIFLVVIALERFVVLFSRMSFDTRDAVDKIKTYVLNKDYTQAIQVCDQKSSAPDLIIAKSALMDIESGREAMRSAIGSSLIELGGKTERRIPIIALIASIATLLGLLGTITGLIKTFAALANVDPAKKGEILGIGISEAMYSTAAGLTVGIAALVLHTFFLSRSNAIRTHAKNTGLKVINWVEKSERT